MRATADHAARVINVLTGEPLTLRDVAHATGLPRRRVEEAIESIRAEGIALVCSDRRGVWLARSLAEAEANAEARRRRAVRQMVTLRGERRLIRRLREPMTLWDGR